jgi:hypothetical protein
MLPQNTRNVELSDDGFVVTAVIGLTLSFSGQK